LCGVERSRERSTLLAVERLNARRRACTALSSMYCSPPASAWGRARERAHASGHASRCELNTLGAWHEACAMGAALGPMPTQEAQSNA